MVTSDGKPAPVIPILSASDFGLLALKNLLMGGIAGMIGASAVYPMDMVKTRLQFQKSTGTPQYNGTVDCFRQIFRGEGLRGFYRGLPAQLVGIAPEKAIKLTMNDMLRYTFTDKQTGYLPLHFEILAGAGAGFFQVQKDSILHSSSSFPSLSLDDISSFPQTLSRSLSPSH
jgi:solute carrier family 25 aspartate/glutamate transporter 12/13